MSLPKSMMQTLIKILDDEIERRENKASEMLKLIEEASDMGEMANIGPKDHKFGVDVKLNILQPSKRILHGERVRVFRGNLDQSFTVTLNSSPNKMKVIGTPFLDKRELKVVVDKIKKYRNVFIQFWNDPGMATEELTHLMKRVDKEYL